MKDKENKIHARTMKSYSLVNLRVVTSGFEIKTFGLPPNLGSLASISPKALETFRLLRIELESYRQLSRIYTMRDLEVKNIERRIRIKSLSICSNWEIPLEIG